MNIKNYLGENNTLGIDIWRKKYRFENETFNEFLNRITNRDAEMKRLVLERKFIYAGRILANRGLQNKGIRVTYSNCYVITPPEDSLEGIYETDYKLARTYSMGGGCGVDVSKLSPNGALVRNAAKSTSGVVSFMEQFSNTTLRIAQHGRRGALMISIDCNHPDIEEFISVKSDLKKIVGANISLRIDDEFMNKVVNDLPHTLTFTRPETGQTIEREVSAKQLFWRLAKMNWRTAEPGILFWDRIKTHTLLHNTKDFEFAGVNPCAEEPLPAGGSCLLASINLSEYVKNPFTNKAYFDFDEFRKDIPTYIKEMNIVLDEGLPLHPLPEQRESVTKWRQIGLGILGLADAFIKLGIAYGSDESLVLSDAIGKALAYEGIKASALLARDLGAYPGFDKEAVLATKYFNKIADEELRLLVNTYGLRNSQVLTIAPTGSN